MYRRTHPPRHLLGEGTSVYGLKLGASRSLKDRGRLRNIGGVHSDNCIVPPLTKLMYFESEFLTVHVCGKLEQAGRKFSDVLSTSKIPKSAFFTLNMDNRKTGSCFELTEPNAMCEHALLIEQETDYQLIERFSSGYVTLS